MATNYPTSADDSTSLPNPTASSKTNSPSLSSGQTNQNDAIKALEAKLGTGASTPADNTFLIGNGAGSTAYAALTSAQLAARLSDETGSGLAVFATTPTLVTPKVDTINEATAANGVTVDGLNIKDGALNTNNSVVAANITEGAVTPAKLVTGTGSTWAWQTWAPTWTNLTVGNGTLTAKYIQVGKIVFFRIGLVLGSTSAVGTNPIFTLPVATNSGYSANTGGMQVLAIGRILDSGSSSFEARITWSNATTANIAVYNAASTYLTTSAVSSTVPMTWTNPDEFFFQGFYEAA